MAKKIEDFFVGQKAELTHRITREDVSRFIELTGDDNPLHSNEEYAAKSTFKGIVTHGMLSASFISTLVGKKIPGEGALWISQSIQFLLPVRLEDELKFVAEVIKVNVKERLLNLKTDVYNQYGQKVLSGEGQVKVLESEAEKETSKEASPETKTVLITGSSRGIGRDIALLLAQNGYQVVVNYSRDESGANQLLADINQIGGRAIACKADISSEQEVDYLFSYVNGKFGPVTHLVNNASPKIIEKGFMETEWSDFMFQLNIQLKGSFLCTKKAIPGMLSAGRGSIVNIGSSVIEGTPPPKWTAYTVAKTALASLTKNLALEYGHKGIRVNMISPGMTDTKLISEIPEKQRLIQAAQTPLRRLADPGEIARACLFLLSDDASYITGENLRVAGGKVMF